MSLVPQPHFTNLRELIINDNNIGNIEALEFLNAPKLTIMILRENQITRLQVFKKLKMDELQFLSLTWNKIVSSEELKTFSRFVTNNKK